MGEGAGANSKFKRTVRAPSTSDALLKASELQWDCRDDYSLSLQYQAQEGRGMEFSWASNMLLRHFMSIYKTVWCQRPDLPQWENDGVIESKHFGWPVAQKTFTRWCLRGFNLLERNMFWAIKLLILLQLSVSKMRIFPCKDLKYANPNVSLYG